MKKISLIILALVVLLIVLFPRAHTTPSATYGLEGKTSYFGNELKADVDGNGRMDSVFYITNQPGGSGTFYYVVATLDTDKGSISSKPVLVGDRIAPQTINKGTGRIVIVNYADRAPGEPFTVRPSFGKSLYLLLDPKTLQFGEVAQNFEGEANPAMMKLGMKVWNWMPTGTTTKTFTLSFKNDDSFSATTDCNGIGGQYTASGNKLSFGSIMSTLMFCELSREGEFTKVLEGTTGYSFTSKGELILNLKTGGTAIFR